MTQSSDPDVQRIIRKIETSGLKKKSVAKRAGLSQVHFSYILNGTRALTDDVREILFSVLEIND